MVKVIKQPSAMTVTIDRRSHTIRLTRTIAAPPSHVFAAWTQPEQLALWWDPCGKPLKVCEISLKIGGSFKFVSRDVPGSPFSGKYLEIAPPDRIAFQCQAGIGRVLLRAVGKRTFMTVEIECLSDEALNRFLEMGVDKGTAKTLENLARFLKQERLASTPSGSGRNRKELV
jgi:uncharacterized protein YndB with AHSA1/START domain